MKRLITTGGLVFAIACQTFAGDNTALARVTAYWPSKGSAKTAASNKAPAQKPAKLMETVEPLACSAPAAGLVFETTKAVGATSAIGL